MDFCFFSSGPHFEVEQRGTKQERCVSSSWPPGQHEETDSFPTDWPVGQYRQFQCSHHLLCRQEVSTQTARRRLRRRCGETAVRCVALASRIARFEVETRPSSEVNIVKTSSLRPLRWKLDPKFRNRIIGELPRCSQQLLVLLFGTFRAVSLTSSSSSTSSSSAAANAVSSSGMSSEALGVSVAPSFFHTCVGAGRQATMDDVIRFKV